MSIISLQEKTKELAEVFDDLTALQKKKLEAAKLYRAFVHISRIHSKACHSLSMNLRAIGNTRFKEIKPSLDRIISALHVTHAIYTRIPTMQASMSIEDQSTLKQYYDILNSDCDSIISKANDTLIAILDSFKNIGGRSNSSKIRKVIAENSYAIKELLADMSEKAPDSRTGRDFFSNLIGGHSVPVVSLDSSYLPLYFYGVFKLKADSSKNVPFNADTQFIVAIRQEVIPEFIANFDYPDRKKSAMFQRALDSMARDTVYRSSQYPVEISRVKDTFIVSGTIDDTVAVRDVFEHTLKQILAVITEYVLAKIESDKFFISVDHMTQSIQEISDVIKQKTGLNIPDDALKSFISKHR